MSHARPRLRWIPIVLLAVSSIPAAGAVERETVDLARVQASITTDQSRLLERRLQELHDRNDVHGLVASVRGEVLVLSNTIAREWLLDRAMQLLATLPEEADARALCAEIAARTPEVFVRSDPEHPVAVPLHDPAAAARFVMRRWTQRASRDQTVVALRTRDLSPLVRYGASASPAELDPAKTGVLEAFSAASSADLLAYRTPLIEAASRGEAVDELLDLFARRLRDEELFALVFRVTRPAVALRALPAASGAFPSQTSVPLLEGAANREELASAALLAIGDLAATDGTARRVLLNALGNPRRAPSAAAALANLHDASVAGELETRLRSERNELAARHLVLALRLDGSDAARAALDRFVQTGAGSPQLRKEIRQWLAR